MNDSFVEELVEDSSRARAALQHLIRELVEETSWQWHSSVSLQEIYHYESGVANRVQETKRDWNHTESRTHQVRNFEDLFAWRKARALAGEVYRATKSEPFSRDYGLTDQIRRAAVSVMANISEGHERTGASQFIYFLSIAKGSCAEVRSHLYIAMDVGYLKSTDGNRLLEMAQEVSRILGGLKSAIERSKHV